MTTIAPREYLSRFALANPLYAEALLYAYVADVSTGAATTTLATLYRATTGTEEEANPFRLDGDGKLARPVYIDGPVVVRAHPPGSTPVHDTGVLGLTQRFRGEWAATAGADAVVYQVGDLVRDDEAGNNTGYIYVCAEAHEATNWDDDLADGKWVLFSEGGSGGGGGGGSGVEGEYTISLDVGTGSDNYIRLVGSDSGDPVKVEAKSTTDDHVTLRLLPKGNAPVWVQRMHFGDSAPSTNPTNTFSRMAVSAPVAAVSDTAYNLARIGGAFFGTLTGGPAGLGLIVAADSDAMNAAEGAQLVYFGHSVTANAIGGRTVHTSRLDINANVNAGTNQYYVAGSRWTNAGGSMGGVHNGPLGNVFAANDIAELLAKTGSLPGAGVNVAQLVGYEVNTASEDNTQAYWHHGLQIVNLSNHVTPAWSSDAGIIFANQPLTAGAWRKGMSFGAVNGKWPFKAASSQLISTFPANSGFYSDAYAALDGIDFSRITFTRSAFRTSGAMLDGSDNFGAQTTAGVSLQTRDGIVAKTAVVASVSVQDPGLFEIGTSPTLTFDAPPGGSGTTATATVATWVVARVGRIDAGGSGYAAGDILTVGGGTGTAARLRVARVNVATGALTDLVPLKAVVTGSISDTTLAVTATAYGSLGVGDPLFGTGITNGTFIISNDGGGNYTVSRSQTVASTTISVQGDSGSYTVQPGAATSVANGSGSGATISLMFGIGSVTVSGAGTNYPQFPPPKLRNSTSGRYRDAMFLVSMTATEAPILLGSNYANYLTITGATNSGVFDTAAPVLQAAGTATHIDFKVLGKGTNGRLNSAKIFVGGGAARSAVADDTVAYFRTGLTYSTTAAPGLRMGGSYAGTVTSGQAFYNQVAIDTDSVDPTTGSGPGGTTGFFVGHNVTAGAKGGRNAIFASLNVNGAITVAASGQYHVALAGYSNASASAGGSTGYGNTRGRLFGGNLWASLVAGAGTAWDQVVGLEVNVGTPATTKAYYKNGVQIVQLYTDAVAGDGGMDCGLVFAGQANASLPGWDFGISFGHELGYWPMKSTSTIIGTTPSHGGVGPSYAAAYGVDFSAVTFSSGAFKSTGFLVDGSGNTTVASAVLGTSGPEILTGSGVPAATKPKGSIYLRTGGGVGSTLYVSQGGGTWNAVASV